MIDFSEKFYKKLYKYFCWILVYNNGIVGSKTKK